MSIQISYKKQIVFFSLLLLILLAIVEISVRIIEYLDDPCTNWKQETQVFKNYDPKLIHQVCIDLHNKPEKYDVIRLEPPNFRSQTLNINSDGFRGPEINKEKPDNVYRIFIVGGSTTFGFGSTSDETTISGYLQKFFDEQDFDFKVEVINAGIEAGYSSTENYYIKNILINYKPDLIIGYDGWNDASDVSIVERINHGDFDIRQLLFYRTPFFIYERLIGYPDREIVFSHQPDDFIIKRSELWKNNWNDVCNFGKMNNFKTIVTVQPIVGTGNKVLSDYESQILKTQPIEHRFVTSGLNEFVKYFTELNHECETTADLRNVLDSTSEPIFWDMGHMTDNGNKIIAKKLFDLSLPVVLQNNN